MDISNLISQAGMPQSLLRANPTAAADPAKWLEAIQATAKTAVEAAGTPSTESGTIDKIGSTAPLRSMGSSFSGGNIALDLVNQVDAKLKAGDSLRSDLLRGESVNLHQVTIALQEAGTAFSLMVEFRNKMMEGYQELMRMQI